MYIGRIQDTSIFIYHRITFLLCNTSYICMKIKRWYGKQKLDITTRGTSIYKYI